MLTAPRLVALSALTAAGLAVGAPPVLAAPSSGPTFTVTCPGLGTFEVVTPPGNGDFTPVFRAGTHGVGIPYEIHGTASAGGQVVDSFDEVKAAPVPSSATTCTFAATFTEEGMTIDVAGTAVVVFRGA